LTFPDLKNEFLLTINQDGSATLEEGTLEQADVKITATSDLLKGILDRRANPVNAYITRKLRVVGNMEDLLRLQKIL
jgi:putative sterol carrier protein